MNKNRRRPKNSVDTQQIKIIRCKHCRAKITFSYNGVGRDGKKIPCNLDGTRHLDADKGGG